MEGGIVFGAVAPHGWLAMPLLAGRDAVKAAATRAALEELGRRLESARPETIVVVDPHGLAVDGTISLLDAAAVQGSTGGPIDLGASRHGYSLRFGVDRELVSAVADGAGDLPVRRVRPPLEFLPLEIEFGTMNPLWYLGATFAEQPDLAVATIGPGVTRAECIAFGRLVAAAAQSSRRRVAFVASVDLAHAHDASGPFGFETEAAVCDAVVVDALRRGDLAPLIDLDEEVAARARTEAIEPLLVLHGLGEAFHAGLLSYEVPTYFGMAVAEFTPRRA